MASDDTSRAGKPPKKVFFFVSDQKIETDHSPLTGAQIKALVPNWTAGYGLLLEGRGDDPDILVADDQSISLEKDHGPLHFTPVPPASYGVA